MDDQRTVGFTLIELLIVISILGVLITSALPAMAQIIERQKLYNAAETIAADLRLFRSEAFNRKQRQITVSFKTGQNWCYGVAIDGCDCNRAASQTHSCTIPRNRLLYHYIRNNTSFSGISVTKAQFTRNHQLRFDGIRGLGQPGTVTITNRSNDQLDIKVSLLGRVRICTRTPNAHRYSSC